MTKEKLYDLAKMVVESEHPYLNSFEVSQMAMDMISEGPKVPFKPLSKEQKDRMQTQLSYMKAKANNNPKAREILNDIIRFAKTVGARRVPGGLDNRPPEVADKIAANIGFNDYVVAAAVEKAADEVYNL